MVLRSVASAAAILLAFDKSVAASGGLNLRRASYSAVGAAASSSVADVLDISAGRSLEGVDLTECYADLVSAADGGDILTKDTYFWFTDIMSNQWFTDNGIYNYNDLSYDMKFAFVTLSCECHNLGGGEDCCQNHRAHLDVDGAAGQDVSQAQTDFLNDICSLTHSTIGPDRTNPTPGDLPTTAQPTPPAPTSPTQPPAPTPSPTKHVDPIITPPTPAPRPVGPPGGVGVGGAIGMALAASAVLALLVFLVAGRKDGEETEEENLDDIEADDMMKVDANAEDTDAPDSDGSPGSPDGTKSMTNSVFSEQSTIVTASNANMLPGMEDSENESSIYVADEEELGFEIPSDASSLSR